MARQWITWKRSLSPVQAAVQTTKEAEAVWATQKAEGQIEAAPTIKKLSQGAEQDRPEGILGDCLSYSSTPDPAYSTDTGGTLKARQNVAAWLEHFVGIKANARGIYIIPGHGRQGLQEVFSFAAAKHIEAGLDPQVYENDPGWPMVGDCAKAAHMGTQQYDGLRRPLDKAVAAAMQRSVLQKASDLFNPLKRAFSRSFREKSISVVNVNSPNNPLGICHTTDENDRLLTNLDTHNINQRRGNLFERLGKTILSPFTRLSEKAKTWTQNLRGLPAMLNLDAPYLASCPIRPAGEAGSFLMSGYEHFRFDGKGTTTKAMVISASKLWGEAGGSPFHIIVMDADQDAPAGTDLSDEFRRQLTATSGLGYPKQFFAGMEKFFAPELYNEHEAHVRKVNTKYGSNNAAAEEILGDFMLPGSPHAMVRSAELPREVFNRRVQCSPESGREFFDVKTVDDLLELALNEGNVVAVKGHDERLYLRMAFGNQISQTKPALVALNDIIRRTANSPAIPEPMAA